jgi:hypothetical protein
MPFPRVFPIEKSSCLAITNCDWDDLINLTGIKGYTDDITDLNVTMQYIETNPDEIEIFITGTGFQLERTVDIERKIIRNERFHLDEAKQKNGLGTQVFLSQIWNAREQGYTELRVNAAISRMNGGPQFVGYLVWSKLGFTMDEDSLAAFSAFLAGTQYATQFDNLNDMILDDQACLFWENNGHRWDGKYDLDPCSPNCILTLRYLSQRCFRVSSI